MTAVQLPMFVEPHWIIENAWPLDAADTPFDTDTYGDTWESLSDAWEWIMGHKESDLDEYAYEGIEDGVREPVVLWHKGSAHSDYAPESWDSCMVIDGHHRTTAAVMYRHPYVPVVWAQAEAEAYSLWDQDAETWLDAARMYLRSS